jgi:hypothetical protein
MIAIVAVTCYENSDDHGPATKPPNGSEQGMESSVAVVINCFVLEGVPNASTFHRQQRSILQQKHLPERIYRLQMDGGSPTYLAVEPDSLRSTQSGHCVKVSLMHHSRMQNSTVNDLRVTYSFLIFVRTNQQ